MPTLTHAYLVVQPAYGVKLTSLYAVYEHYLSGKDFLILSPFAQGSYINRADAENLSSSLTLEVRYGKKGKKVTLLNTATPKALCAILAREQHKAQARSKGKGKEKKEEKGFEL